MNLEEQCAEDWRAFIAQFPESNTEYIRAIFPVAWAAGRKRGTADAKELLEPILNPGGHEKKASHKTL